jgi:tetratricopeptide (TPR) repeat protein
MTLLFGTSRQGVTRQFSRLPLALALALCAQLACTGALAAKRELATQPETREIAKLINSDLDTAYDKAEAYADTHDTAEAHYWLGATAGNMASKVNFLSAASYAKQVKREFERAAALDPTHIEARMGLIQFHLQAPGIVGGDEDQVPVLIQQISALDKGAGLRADAGLKMSEKKDAAAQALYLQALTLDAADSDALAGAISVMAKSQSFAPAAALVQAALVKAPTDNKIRYQAGKLAALSGTQLEQGLAHLDALIALNPAPTDVSPAGMHMRRGQILAKLGRKPEAISALERAQSLQAMPEIKAELAKLKKG